MSKLNSNNYFGYIEGYYGKLLNWEDRVSIINKLHENNMNCYLYAPKEDICHRFLWRQEFDNDWILQFKNFCKISTSNKISILAGVSPGLDFNFKNRNSFKKDFETLKDKFSKLLEFGAQKIVLLLDDIPNNFNKRFRNLREGFEHANLCNQLNNHFKNNLLIIPRVYSDELITESKDYIELFLENLDKNILILYTGEYIISHRHKSKNPLIKKKIRNNKVIFWDNFYANDYCPNKLYTGWPKFSQKNSILFNLTGMINTDKLILDIIGSYKIFSKNKSLKNIFTKHGIPKTFLKIFNFFNEPIDLNKIEIRSFNNTQNTIDHIDELLWKWKTPLSREWYPFLFKLKTDLQIYNESLEFDKIIKTQTIPMQHKLKQLKEKL